MEEYTSLKKRHKSPRKEGSLRKRDRPLRKHGTLISKGRWYWWVHGSTPKGRHGLYGPRDTREEVLSLGQSKGLIDPEAVELKTSNENKATRMVRARRFKGDATFDEVLDNMSHS